MRLSCAARIRAVRIRTRTSDAKSQRLAKLVDTVTTTAPTTLLVVAPLVPTRTDSLNADVQRFNDAVAKLVDERARAGKHVRLVNMYGAFTSKPNYEAELLFDGLHPNDAGYEVIAKVWYDALADILR